MSVGSHSGFDGENLDDEDYEYAYDDDDKDESFVADHFSESGRFSSGSQVIYLDREDVFDYVRKQILRSAEALNLPFIVTLVLLRQYRWDHDALYNNYFEDAKRVLDKCRIIGDSSNLDYSLEQKGISYHQSSGTTSAPAASTLTSICGVCAQEVSDDTMYAIGCHHFFCKDCWAQYIGGKIKEAQCLALRCMEVSCSRPMSREVVQCLISPEELQSYDRFLAQAIVDEHPDMLWCPSISCGRVLLWNQSLRTADVVTCLCGSVFCIKCKRPPHQPALCLEMKDWESRGEGASESFRWLKNNTKDCPKCHSPIEKNGGCNHIYCKMCRHEFCWSCMGTWHNHTTRDHPGCHGYVADKNVSKEREDMERFGHYFTRYTVHLESEKIETMLMTSIQEKIETMDEYAVRKIQSSSLYNSSSLPVPQGVAAAAMAVALPGSKPGVTFRDDHGDSMKTFLDDGDGPNASQQHHKEPNIANSIAVLKVTRSPRGGEAEDAVGPYAVPALANLPPQPPLPKDSTPVLAPVNNISTVSAFRKVLSPRRLGVVRFFGPSSSSSSAASSSSKGPASALTTAAVKAAATAAAAAAIVPPAITASSSISSEIKIKPSSSSDPAAVRAKRPAFSLSSFWGINRQQQQQPTSSNSSGGAAAAAEQGADSSSGSPIKVPKLDPLTGDASASAFSSSSSSSSSASASATTAGGGGGGGAAMVHVTDEWEGEGEEECSPRSPLCYGLVPGDTDYLLNAVRVLCDCRRVLKHTYIHAFYIKSEQELQLFEFLQLQLEMSTEELSDLLEHFWTERHTIVNKTAAVQHRLALVLEGVHEDGAH